MNKKKTRTKTKKPTTNAIWLLCSVLFNTFQCFLLDRIQEIWNCTTKWLQLELQIGVCSKTDDWNMVLNLIATKYGIGQEVGDQLSFQQI